MSTRIVTAQMAAEPFSSRAPCEQPVTRPAARNIFLYASARRIGTRIAI